MSADSLEKCVWGSVLAGKALLPPTAEHDTCLHAKSFHNAHVHTLTHSLVSPPPPTRTYVTRTHTHTHTHTHTLMYHYASLQTYLFVR